MLGTITLTVGQPDSVSAVQKEEAPETMDTTLIKDEADPQAKGEKAEMEPADANDIAIVEEKVAEEKQEEANEVGFKKIFRFVGFKFTLKKDKNEEKDPVKLLKVKDKEGDDAVVDDATEKVTEEAAQETTTTEEKVDETTAATPVDNGAEDTDKAAAPEVPAEGAAADAVDENAKEEVTDKEPEKESSPPSQEATQSSFRKLLSGGLFSNLRKKASIKKTKEEEEKETTAEEEIKEGDETAEAVKEEGEEVEQEPKEEQPATTTEEAKPEPTTEAEVNAETTAPAADNAEQPKAEEEKAEGAEEEKPITETELLSSQEKAKTHGSPLKKLFNGAGLKKLSSKKHKSKKEAESKLTESGEQAAELQSSTETEEAPKAESGPSSPEDSGEHAIEGEASQIESSQETEGEVTSDGEKKKDGIIPWSSFKKLVTPKKRVKKSSESDEETAEKPAKSATLSSTESAVFEEKTNEEEPKEDNATEDEPKTETTDKLVSSTEEPKKKMDTSVSWEALMCMGGPKKRTRKTSDSDDDETKLEEEASPAVGEEEQEAKAEESPALTSTEVETEDEVVPAEAASQQEKESAWDTLKRFVFSKNKPKVEEKAEETPEQVPSDGEVQKEESMFSLRKLFPGRKKKKAEQQASNEMGSGEEDSDTPAVVPLSEYDTEKTEDKQEEPSEPAVTQTKASVEDRSPSWIPAIVEDGDGKHDQLSDIPEEADNAATPKSADTTIEEDDEEHPSIPPTSQEPPQRQLSLVKPIVPTISHETTPVSTGLPSENTEMVLEAVVEKIIEIPCQTSVDVEDVPLEEASAGTEFEPVIEHAESQKKTILEPHTSEEAMAISTGLGTKEIAKVALEKPVMSTAECLTVTTDSLCTEVALEEKPANLEVAVATEDLILEAQVQQVDTTELEPATDKLPSDMPGETATKSEEPETEKISLIACHPELSEIAQPAELDEDTTKFENSDPIAPTVETTVYTETVEITQPAVEVKEEVVELEQFVAVEENAPVQEIIQVVTQQSITVETTATESVIVESSPCVEVERVEIKAEVEITNDTKIEEALISGAVADISAQAVVEDVVVEFDASNNNKTEANVIEEQSIIIAQAVIENAMDKVLEAQAEAPKPTTPTPTEEISTPVQALITTEETIEVDTAKPIITEAPVAIICEAPTASPTQTPNAPAEVVESLDGPTESEEKPAGELKQVVEVNTSEENVSPKEVAKEESKEEVDAKSCPIIHMPVQMVLQTATVVEDTLLEEAVVEFDTNGPAVQDTDVKPECEKPESCAGRPTLLEEPQTQASTEVTAASQDVPAAATAEAEKAVAANKCAEVMAQVMEVIEEAVKEIEPISSEITAAS